MTNECWITMVKLRVSVVLILLASVNLVEPLVQEGLSKFLGSITGIKNVRIPELLNQLCNQSQGSNTTRRDACYGCFFRATSQTLGYSLLMAISNCADIYLNNTDYGHCQQYLRNATSMMNSRTSATTIYCSFLECVRQVNKDTLLRECVGEAIRIFPNFNLTDVKLAQLYVNTTACVLAKTRCSQMNPITGEFQEDDLANKLNIPTVNAVLVNTNYDINIVQLPFHSSSIDVCAKYRNYEQASWPTVMC
ncbi:hypothetical protein HZU73_06865 [Apis mellifera caucasica]|uniref:Uncharacterized protein LOC102656489 n=1 Tax=Apis mellifera TaxID=7460 RepID=A0A7M7IJW4_APIME|nr:uncharacterized protein LOC102656489 [Apis mellifera]KAG6797545.1 hypothetical protein HZU73_06865 [Apis mellifera caucasica]KAG9437395.1 hypothetical protein HZU67_00404 [Apis mellifera carnica]|eukprot:XP_016773095.1 uncharacterized protein LOC102656489 [Apis mellifera]